MIHSDEFSDEVRRLAEKKIRCRCGNGDWRQFMYVKGGPDYFVGGCKRCGTIHKLDNGAWREIIAGPVLKRD